MTLADRVRQVLIDAGGAPVTVEQAAAALPGDPRESIAATFANLRSARTNVGTVRLGSGIYAWRPDSLDDDVPFRSGSGPRVGRERAGATPKAKPTPRRDDTFDDVVAAIPDDVFGKVGMVVVANARDGGRIVTDENGTAWMVTVTIEARLL